MSITPNPIRSDLSNAFAHDTFARRLPEIVQDILHSNYWLTDAMRADLSALRDALMSNAEIAPLALPAPDADLWAEDFEKHHGARWQDAEWFFAETLFFRHVIQCTRYFENGLDPYWPMKSREFSSDGLKQLIAAVLDAQGDLHALIGFALWGNRVDLSHPSGLRSAQDVMDDELLADDRHAVIARLEAGGAVHVITDNAGSELAMDLALTDALLTRGHSVTLHMKMHPTYVSDATPRDFRNFLELLESGTYDDDVHGPAKAWGGRLRDAFNRGALRVAPDFFWNSSRWLTQIPPRVQRVFDGAALVILKGDANYRRSTFDTITDSTVRYTDATAYFPHPLMAVRTLKSDPVFSVDAGTVARLDAKHAPENWRVTGQYGVIHFKP